MKLVLWHILICLFSFGSHQGGCEEWPANFTVADFINIPIKGYYDSLGLIDLYGARVYTPVCEGKKCYSIEIDLYWDVLGRYHHFDTVPGKGLSKLDHIPLTSSDYCRLDTVLRDPQSILSSYSMEELVENTRSSGIDGITGATLEVLKRGIVDGAVYSCYTLWHIAHGPVVDSLKKATKGMLSQELVQKMVELDDQDIFYYLIHSFSDQEFKSYLPEVLITIREGEGYYSKNAIESIPDEILADSLSQAFFAEFYPELDYFAQVALLESLNSQNLSEALKSVISNEEEERDSYKYELVKKLVSQ